MAVQYFKGDSTGVEKNEDFRRVVYTGDHIQAVLMTVPAGEEIGEEVHEEHDQMFFIVVGEGKVTIGEEKVAAQSGDVIIIPARTYHNVKSLGPGALKMYSFCAPPHHPDGIVHPTKASAAPAQEH